MKTEYIVHIMQFICTLYFYTLKHKFKQSRAMNVVVYIEHCLVCSLKRGNQKW